MRLPIFNPPYNPLIFSVLKGFWRLRPRLAGIFLAYDSPRIPRNCPHCGKKYEMNSIGINSMYILICSA